MLLSIGVSERRMKTDEVDAMTMPGFTAELSLNSDNGYYRAVSGQVSAAEEMIEPAGPVLWAACMVGCCGLSFWFCGPAWAACCWFCVEGCAPALAAPTP